MTRHPAGAPEWFSRQSRQRQLPIPPHAHASEEPTRNHGMIFNLFGKSPEADAANAVYGAIVAQSRQRRFYAEWGVPDTVPKLVTPGTSIPPEIVPSLLRYWFEETTAPSAFKVCPLTT